MNPTSTLTHRSGSALRRTVADHPVASYLVTSFAVTWAILFPITLSGRPAELGLPAVVLLAQLLPAVLITAAEGGRTAVHRLLARTFRWRVNPGWYALAAFGLPLVILLGAMAFRGLEPARIVLADPSLISGYLLALSIFPLINLWEETGWMFVQHRLAQQRGPLVAATITGPLFGLLHLPLYVHQPTLLGVALVALAVMAIAIPHRIVIWWLYQRTGQSVLLVALFHAAYNASNSTTLLEKAVPGVAPYVLTAIATTGLAALIIALRNGRSGVAKTAA
jgi:membrane protease YdiL (CAAX protease family)